MKLSPEYLRCATRYVDTVVLSAVQALEDSKVSDKDSFLEYCKYLHLRRQAISIAERDNVQKEVKDEFLELVLLSLFFCFLKKRVSLI